MAKNTMRRRALLGISLGVAVLPLLGGCGEARSTPTPTPVTVSNPPPFAATATPLPALRPAQDGAAPATPGGVNQPPRQP